ncbi:MAG TPA: hypothetical protein VF456_16435 [Vicinamibacterales bacterium]
MDVDTVLSMHNQYSMLDLSDLLLARERNHVELMRKENVIGTAVGLYLIRKDEPWSKRSAEKSHEKRAPRTLGNSEVRDYSWPCILVFVDTWKTERELHWQDRVPEAVYLDEKRKVPVCVVYAPKQDVPEIPIRPVLYPSSKIGGGFPLIVDVQGQEHIASIGCLVRDGHTVYALTNRHVTGAPGEPIYARLGGETIRIGQSSSKQLSRLPFTKMYPDFSGKDTYLNVDIGLVRVDDVNRWTAAVYGIGTMGPLADLGMDNLSIRLIDCPVRAYGCGSGHMQGAIKALFYRYKSVGGFEYVSDFLIGAREPGEDLKTHPGDSGTVWLLESKTQGLMPIAVQWGGQVFGADGGAQQSSYALATCLSTVCNLLDVDVVRDWNVGVSQYWGEVGHFAIGALACTVGFTGQPELQRLMSRNLAQVGFEVKDLRVSDKVRKSVAKFSFVPLADVADDVWRMTRISHGDTGNDENNHFADMDQRALSGKFKGKTLLQLSENPANIDPAVWADFYKSVPGTNPGALPFRVWQGYNLMVDAARRGNALEFLCVAGCTAHYVGDACQPLHISRLHHGDPDHKTSVSMKVHSVYETEMPNAHAADLVDGIVAALKNKSVTASFTGGHGAAMRVVRLMKETVKALPPKDIVDAYNAEKTPAARLKRMFDDFGKKTIDRMAEGALCMADIWASAWKEGGGAANVPATDLVAQDQGALQDMYRKASFFPSMSLERMIPILTGAEAPHPVPHLVSSQSPNRNERVATGNNRRATKRRAAKSKRQRVA